MPSTSHYPLSLFTTVRQALQLLEKEGINPAELLQVIIDKPMFRKDLVDAYNQGFLATLLGIPENPMNLGSFLEFTVGWRFYELEREEKRLRRLFSSDPEYVAKLLAEFASSNAKFEECVEFFSEPSNFAKAFSHLNVLSVSIVVAYLGSADGNRMTLEDVAASHRVSVARCGTIIGRAGRVMRANVEALLDMGDVPSLEQLPIEALELSIRTENALKRPSRIRINNTVADLANMSESDLLAIHNMGQKSLDEIINKLAEHGLRLKQ